VPIIQILAFAGTISAITSSNVQAYLALGRPRLVVWILIARLGLLGIAIVVLIGPHGVHGVAMAELVSSLGSLFVSLPILSVTLQLTVAQYLRSTMRPLLACTLMGVTMVAVLSMLPAREGVTAALIELLVGVCVGTSSYPAFVALLWRLGGRPQSIEVQVASRVWGWLHSRLHR
jgi:O-antigen/teichoic acid export membrane protein